jgi:2-(1,2-epoxy-1,2-dihydrophenyl)acetyl-CoA isomerase
VNGAVAGAGLSLVLACDLVVAGSTATFRAGFAAVGAVPDLAVAYTLPRAVGMVRAKEILLAGRSLSAQEAVEAGLVGRVVEGDRLMEEALEAARRLAEGPVSIRLTKALLNRAYDDGLAPFLQREQDAQAVAFSSEDFAEGVAAFLAKRRPRFGQK